MMDRGSVCDWYIQIKRSIVSTKTKILRDYVIQLLSAKYSHIRITNLLQLTG